MTTSKTITSYDDIIDVRSVIERIEDLEQSVHEALSDEPTEESDAEELELKMLSELMEELKGNGGDEQWRGDWYPISLIRDSYFVQAMMDLCEDIGDFPNGVPSYYVIDWEATAKNLQMDYSSVEFDGVTYWYR